MEPNTLEKNKELLDRALNKIDNDDSLGLAIQLQTLHAADIANIIESLPPTKRRVLWDVVSPERESEILVLLHEEARSAIINKMELSEVVAAAEQMDMGDLAHVINTLPDNLTNQVLQSLDEDYRKRLEITLNFPEHSAGRLMSRDVISVRKNVSLAVVQRYLRFHTKLPPHTDTLMVIDDLGRHLGQLSLADVLTQSPDSLVEDVMQPGDVVSASASEHEIVSQFERRDLISVAVVNESQHLLGRITIDDVIGIIRDEADKAYLQHAGLNQDEDLFAPILPSAKRRALWLGTNLLTVFLAAWVIGRFEQVLDQLVALAVLMPVVASMGGIAGSQTLTLTIRGQALGQITAGNIRWLLKKELAVGLLNGIAWAIGVALITQLWFDNWGISVVIAIAMVINLFVAALSGVAIPVLLKSMGVDPALSGAVVLTTITDIVGFMTFLGMATWLFL